MAIGKLLPESGGSVPKRRTSPGYLKAYQSEGHEGSMRPACCRCHARVGCVRA